MSKFFLVVRIIILVALIFLLTAVFWGLANRESSEAIEDIDLYERYQRAKPAGYTSFLLVGLVVLGIFVVVASILLEFHQVRSGTREVDTRPPKEKKRPWS